MPIRVTAAVILACLVGLVLRSTNAVSVFPPAGVFPSDDWIVLGIDDSYYHARRSLYAFENFPAILEFDRYLAHPRGAAQPSPPLHDWLIAGTARVFGSDLRTFELTAAWISPVLAALLSLSAFWIAAALAGAGVGVVASWLAAVIPAGALITSLGNCDHHATVALLVSLWIAASLRELRIPESRLAAHGVLHAAIVAAMLLTWSGSLLYLAIGEGARLLAIALCRPQRERMFAMAGSDLLAAAVVGAWLLVSAAPLGGPLTSQTLSWLHVAALVSIAALAALLGVFERARPVARPAIRLARAALIGSCLALPALALPEIRDAVATGLRFIGKQDAWAATNPEQLPLFHGARESVAASATTRFGYLVYALPLLPLLVAWLGFRAPAERRALWLVVFLWMLPLCALALSQIRYATDFAALAAVGFALLLAELRGLLARWIGRRLSVVVAALLALALLAPAFDYHAPRISRASAQISGRESAAPGERLSKAWTSYAFARMVRAATPETAGFLDGTVVPEYGVLVQADLGHVFTYVARRPVPANNLGPYLDPDLHRRVQSFYQERVSEAALEILESLEVRYFVTSLSRLATDTFAAAVHFSNDGGAPWAAKRPSTGRVRLVAEGPPRGRPFRFSRVSGERAEVPAFKLFEVVEGALLVGDAEPNAAATAELTLETPLGRVSYRTAGRADATGRLRLRVAHPSEAPDAEPRLVGALGPWRVELGGRAYEVAVSEADVREGREVPLD